LTLIRSGRSRFQSRPDKTQTASEKSMLALSAQFPLRRMPRRAGRSHYEPENGIVRHTRIGPATITRDSIDVFRIVEVAPGGSLTLTPSLPGSRSPTAVPQVTAAAF